MAISGGFAHRLDGVSCLAGRVGVMICRGFQMMLLLPFMTIVGSTFSARGGYSPGVKVFGSFPPLTLL
jgi:hypothetical protein